MIKFLPFDSIEIPANRQRKYFDEAKNSELVESLQSTVGLQNAIVIRTSENGTPYLVSGERRLRAILDMDSLGIVLRYAGQPVKKGMVPCVDVGELSPIAQMEAEFEENACRLDLTWQERSVALSGLMRLRVAQADAAGEATPTHVDLAKEVYSAPEKAGSSSQNIVRQQLILADHLDDPDVKAATSVKEAFKVLKKKEQVARNTEHAAEIGLTYSSKHHQIFNENCLDWMEDAEPNQFAVILTDPPYGMGADDFGDSGGKAAGGHAYDDSADVLETIMQRFPALSYKVATENAHIYLFCDLDWFPFIRQEMSDAGWQVFRTPLIWVKPNAFRAPWPNKGPQRTYECILYAMKGDRSLHHMGKDVLTFAPDENVGHSAQKPVALYQELLERSARPGDKVLDCFCGSGTIFPAATAVKAYATGIEMDSAHFGLAAKRLGEIG
jgi:site-specific DNA-methyltransferase (adenine-specific)